MDKTLKIFIASLVGVIILIVVIDDMRVKPVNWDQTYSIDTKNPLDLYVFNEQVTTFFNEKTFSRYDNSFYQYISEHKDSVRNYLIIDYSAYFDMDSILLKTIKNGSNLFISAEDFDQNLIDSLKITFTDLNYSSPLLDEDSVYLMLTTSDWRNKSLKIKKSFNNYFFVDLDKKNTTILGEMQIPNEEVFPSFIRIKYGKGNIFLHNQPTVFTNYNLLKPQSSANYVAHILSYIPKNLPTVWMVRYQTKHSLNQAKRSPLSVIFKYPALRATWLIFLYGLLLYVLFNAKRRQRIVPIIKPLKNTTIEFTQSIGNLYLQEINATSITAKKIIYFLDKIRNRYYLDTKTLDDEFVKRLHTKSGKDIQLIKEIVYRINKFNKNKYAEQENLIYFNQLMENFWEE